MKKTPLIQHVCQQLSSTEIFIFLIYLKVSHLKYNFISSSFCGKSLSWLHCGVHNCLPYKRNVPVLGMSPLVTQPCLFTKLANLIECWHCLNHCTFWSRQFMSICLCVHHWFQQLPTMDIDVWMSQPSGSTGDGRHMGDHDHDIIP